MFLFFTNIAVLLSLLKKVFSHAKFMVLALIIAFTGNSTLAANKPVEITFCYENKEFFPHFLGNSTVVPRDNPGVVVDTLRELDIKESRINIKFIRQPWARCLKGLVLGSVSAVVGSYSTERAKYGVYPKKRNKIDHTRAFSKLATCLLHKKSEKIMWDGEKLILESPLTVAVPRGYKIAKKLQNMGFTIYITDSLDHAHKLLFFNRVAASISDCTFQNFPAFITMNKAPIRNHYGHLILNHSFYNKNKVLSESLWDELQKIDKQKYYQSYLKKSMLYHSAPQIMDFQTERIISAQSTTPLSR